MIKKILICIVLGYITISMSQIQDDKLYDTESKVKNCIGKNFASSSEFASEKNLSDKSNCKMYKKDITKNNMISSTDYDIKLC